MRFFKEFNGFIFEFNSVGEYLRFLRGDNLLEGLCRVPSVRNAHCSSLRTSDW